MVNWWCLCCCSYAIAAGRPASRQSVFEKIFPDPPFLCYARRAVGCVEGGRTFLSLGRRVVVVSSASGTYLHGCLRPAGTGALREALNLLASSLTGVFALRYVLSPAIEIDRRS